MWGEGRSERSRGGDGVIKGKLAACGDMCSRNNVVVATAVIVASDEMLTEGVEFLPTGRARGNRGEVPSRQTFPHTWPPSLHSLDQPPCPKCITTCHLQ